MWSLQAQTLQISAGNILCDHAGASSLLVSKDTVDSWQSRVVQLLEDNSVKEEVVEFLFMLSNSFSQDEAFLVSPLIAHQVNQIKPTPTQDSLHFVTIANQLSNGVGYIFLLHPAPP